MATGTLISDRKWHSSPTLNYSVTYETERPNIYSKTVRVKFTVTIRSIYSSCKFPYPIYFSNTIDNEWRTITPSFGSGIKSVTYTSDWISFSSEGTSLTVGITPKCGDGGHTSYDEGVITFTGYTVPKANFTTYSVTNTSLNSLTVSWATDLAVNYIGYSLNNGSTFKATSGNVFTINNLTPRYNI